LEDCPILPSRPPECSVGRLGAWAPVTVSPVHLNCTIRMQGVAHILVPATLVTAPVHGRDLVFFAQAGLARELLVHEQNRWRSNLRPDFALSSLQQAGQTRGKRRNARIVRTTSWSGA